MKCPECGSSKVQRSAAVYEQSVRTSEGRSVGVFLTSRGTFGVGGSKHVGRSSSLAADRNAPPEPVSIKAKAAGACGIILMFLYVQFSDAGFVETWLIASIIALLGLGVAIYLSAPTDEQEAEQRRWERQWYCRQCGGTFLEEGPASQAPDNQPRLRTALTFVSPVVGSKIMHSRQTYVERVINPVQRAANMTDRDYVGLAEIRNCARPDGTFDPQQIRCDLGIISRLSSLGLITYDRATGRFVVPNSGTSISARNWWQRTFG